MIFRKIFTLLIILVAIPVFSFASDQSKLLVREGRQLLFNDGMPTYQGIVDADLKFAAAVQADNTDQEARLFRAVTRLAGFALVESSSPYKTAADIVSAMGIPILLDRFLDVDSPYGNEPELEDHYNPPENLPNGDDLRGVLNQGLIGVIDDCLSDLGIVQSGIQVGLTSQELDDMYETQVDYTDVLLAKSGLNALKAVVLILSAYDMNTVDANDLLALLNSGMADIQPNFVTGFLSRYPDFLKLDSTGVTQLDTAKDALHLSYNQLVEASNAFAGEAEDSQDHDLFVFESEGDVQMFDSMINMFSELIDSLDNNRPATHQDVTTRWLAEAGNDTFNIELGEGQLGNGTVFRIPEDHDFTADINGEFVMGEVLYWDDDEGDVFIILEYWGDRRIVVEGSLNTEGDTVTGTLYYQHLDIDGFVNDPSQEFTATRQGIDTDALERMDFNAIFGNPNKKLDIRESLPEFDVTGEPLAGSFREPLMNGLYPDYETNAQAAPKLDLDPPYQIFEIPTAAITLDGAKTDWPENSIVAQESADWNNNQGMDIVKAYLAKDADNLYIAMELAGEPIESSNGNPVYYFFEIRADTDEWWHDNFQFQAFYDSYDSQWKVHVSQRDGQGNYNEITVPDDISIGIGTSFIEWKLPLTQLGDLQSYGGQWLCYSTWSDTLQGGDWIDTNTRLAPVFPVTGTVDVPEYTGGNIYYYLSQSDMPPIDGDGAITGTYMTSDTDFSLTGAPYSSEPLYVHAFWDADGNGILNSGDYAGTASAIFNGGTESYDLVSIKLESMRLVLSTVGVKNVHRPDGLFSTYFDIELLVGYREDDIKSITVIDPDGVQSSIWPNDGAQWEYPSNGNDPVYFFFEMSGSPKIGPYTFKVTTHSGLIEEMTDTQKDLITIPVVDTNQVSFDNSSKTPIFHWEGVEAEGTDIAYRFEVKGVDVDYSFRTNRDWGMMTCTLKEVQAGKTYKYRIRACDDSDWIEVDNRSHTEWIDFTMNATLDHAAVPALDLNGWGAVKYSHVGDQQPSLSIETKVVDHDGVSYDGSSHAVYVRPLDSAGSLIGGDENKLFLRFDYSNNEVSGVYSGWLNSDQIPDGAVGVKFFVKDLDGIEKSLVDNLDSVPMELPQDINLACTVNGTTPTFSWNAVTGAYYYRIRIYRINNDGSRGDSVVKFSVPNATEQTIPPGLLAPNTTYQYRVEARSAHFGSFDFGYSDNDENIVLSPRDEFNNYPTLTTGASTDTPFIQADTSGASTWTNKYMGTFPSFWIKVYDAQGVDDIDSVKVIFPDTTTETELRFEYSESNNCGIYSNDAFVPVQNGTYTFEAVDKAGHTVITTEALTGTPIGYPAESTLSVTVVDNTGANFNWEEVPGAAFYRVEIYDKNYKRIYEFTTTENQFSLASGFLKESEPYKFRVTTRDAFWDQNADHGSSSPWSSYDGILFKTGPAGTGGTHAPELEDYNFGAVIAYIEHPMTGKPSYMLQFSIKVSDLDGVPGNIKSVTVQGPEGISLDLGYDGGENDTSSEYWGRIMYDDLDDIPEGDYTFTVEDEDSKSATLTDTLVKNPVPLAEYGTPSDGALVFTDNPVIEWDEPQEGGPYFYKVRLYKHFNTRVHNSAILDTTRYEVPTGVIEKGGVYSYRIYAYGADPRETDVDNFSIRNLFSAHQNHFSASESLLDFDLRDVLRSMGILIGMPENISSLEADVNEDGKLGLQDIVPGLQELGDVRDDLD